VNVPPDEPAICVDLAPDAGAAESDSSAVLTYLASSEPTGAPQAQERQIIELFNISPALFVENKGQWSDPSIRYVHDGNGVDVAMTDSGVLFDVARSEPGTESDRDSSVRLLQFSALFVGANQVRPVGLERSESLFNYYIGDQADWREGVPSYRIVAYNGLYDGIDLRTWGLRSHLKYEFHVAPGADYHQIAVHYEGIEGLSIGEDGSLEIDLGAGWGVIRDDAPYIYQEIDGRKVEVSGRFVLMDSHTYSFEVTGTIDLEHELVIDPDLAWSTYLGGNGDDRGRGIAVDSSGNVFVTGETISNDFTGGSNNGGTNNSFKGGFYGGDAFVAKLGSSGTLDWATYLGGSKSWDWWEGGYGIAVDSSGNAFVTGYTDSNDFIGASNNGGTNNSFKGGDYDAFVAKLTPSGTLSWATYLGGSGEDRGLGIAVDSSGNAFVTGDTGSSDFTGGSNDGGANNSKGGWVDAFVAKLTSSGVLSWATYLGRSWYDHGVGIAVDSSGNVFVTGGAGSGYFTGGSNNGGTNNSFKDGFTDTGGYDDAFVAKLTSSGLLSWATYLGGYCDEEGTAIAVDSSGNAFVTGWTRSNDLTGGSNEGGTNNSFKGNGLDGFVAKLTSSGTLSWATYLGGAGYGIAVDSAGNALVTGQTATGNFTGGSNNGGTNNSFKGGDTDAFVAKLTSSGTLSWATYLGGSGNDEGCSIAADSLGNAFVTGWTMSSDFTGGSNNGGMNNTFKGGDYDAFVAKISPGNEPPQIYGLRADPIIFVRGQEVTIYWRDSDPDSDAKISLAYDRDDSTTPWEGPANHTWIAEGLSEDADGTQGKYVWHTASVHEGTYTIWAQIDDGINPPSYCCAARRVVIIPPASDQSIRVILVDQNHKNIHDFRFTLEHGPLDLEGSAYLLDRVDPDPNARWFLAPITDMPPRDFQALRSYKPVDGRISVEVFDGDQVVASMDLPGGDDPAAYPLWVPPGSYRVKVTTTFQVDGVSAYEETQALENESPPLPSLIEGMDQYGSYEFYQIRSFINLNHRWTYQYSKRYTYHITSILSTHVDPGEPDEAFICVPTGAQELIDTVEAFNLSSPTRVQPLDIATDAMSGLTSGMAKDAATEMLSMGLRRYAIKNDLLAGLVAEESMTVLDLYLEPNNDLDDWARQIALTAGSYALTSSLAMSLTPLGPMGTVVGVVVGWMAGEAIKALPQMEMRNSAAKDVAGDLLVRMDRSLGTVTLINRGETLSDVRLALFAVESYERDSREVWSSPTLQQLGRGTEHEFSGVPDAYFDQIPPLPGGLPPVFLCTRRLYANKVIQAGGQIHHLARLPNPSHEQVGALSVDLNSHSDLHVYDPEGRHLGIDYDTLTLEQGIPGAEFTYLDEDGNVQPFPTGGVIPEEWTQRAVVPAIDGEQYRVELVGTSDGDYSLTVGGFQDGRWIDGQTYEGTIQAGQSVSLNTAVASDNDDMILLCGPLADGSPLGTAPEYLYVVADHDSPSVSFDVTELTGRLDLHNVTISCSDLVGTTSTISAANISFDENGFDLPASAQKRITTTIAIPPGFVGPVSGTITVGCAEGETRSVPITLAVNTAPSFTKGPDQTVLEDAGEQRVDGWVQELSRGPEGESGQQLTFLVTSDNESLFSVLPAISSDGTLTYTPAANASGAATVTVAIRDDGGTVYGGQDTSAQQTFSITISPVNDAPVNTVPVAQTTYLNADLIFSPANGNTISISDVDVGNNSVQVSLAAGHGVMTLGANTGLSFSTGDGMNDSTMVFTGTIANVNAALDGLVFHPKKRYSGPASVQITTNDHGNTGSGGALSDTDTVSIAVEPWPDLRPTAVDSGVWQSAEPGTPVDWTVTVKNSGRGPQAADWIVQWYLSSDKKYQNTDILIGSETYSDDIAKGASVSKTYNAPVPAVPTAGQKYVIARVINAGPDGKRTNDTRASKDKDWFGQVDPDADGANNTPETAFDLGSPTRKVARPNLTIDSSQDVDWYKFTMTKAGTSKSKVQIDFANAEGDLALVLCGSDGTPIRQVDKTGKTESIKLKGLAAGTYYLKVLSLHGDVSRNYKLTLIL
jgi:hypothetical protein